jgi:hypothetical protein
MALTDEQITVIVREAAKGSALRRDGSTTHRIARAIEAAATAPLLERIAFLEELASSEGSRAVAYLRRARGAEARIAALEAQVEQAAQPVDIDTLTDKIASMLGLTYHCTRVWDAWYVGTMSQDDFEPVDESDTPREIAEEIFKLYTSPPKAAPLTEAATSVLAERQRQISVEGWTPEHDDEHDGGELSAAASAHTLCAADQLHPFSQGDGDYVNVPPAVWPWAAEGWRPSSPRRMLVKAGALILAEIERIDRANGITPATVEKGGE